MDAVGIAARAIKSGLTQLRIAGGVEALQAPVMLSRSA